MKRNVKKKDLAYILLKYQTCATYALSHALTNDLELSVLVIQTK